MILHKGHHFYAIYLLSEKLPENGLSAGTAGTNAQNVQMITCPLSLPMWIISIIRWFSKYKNLQL